MKSARTIIKGVFCYRMNQTNNQVQYITHTHTRLTAVCPWLPGRRYRKSKTNLDFIEARDSKWQWHQLGYMQVGTSLQADNHASTPMLSFLQTGCPSCHPTNSVKALKTNANTFVRYIRLSIKQTETFQNFFNWRQQLSNIRFAWCFWRADCALSCCKYQQTVLLFTTSVMPY